MTVGKIAPGQRESRWFRWPGEAVEVFSWEETECLLWVVCVSVCVRVCVRRVLVTKSCRTLLWPPQTSPPGSSAREISQASRLVGK